MRSILLIAVVFVVSFKAIAQKADIEPSISPEFFSADQEIIISYDVSGTSLQNLDEAWLWLWLPDNQAAEIESNKTPALDYQEDTDVAKFSKTVTNGRHVFSLSLVLTDFIGLSADEINTIGLLIKGNDWSDGQSIDYVTEVTNELTVKFVEPSEAISFYESGTVIDIEVKASELATLSIFVDDQLLASEESVSNLSVSHAIMEDGQFHQILARAETNSESAEVEAFYSLHLQEVSVPDGMQDGINYHDDGNVTLVLLAPTINNVLVIGDFNDWKVDTEYVMNRDGERFWLTLTGLNPDEVNRYQYLLDGEIRIADPYSEKIGSPYDDSEIISDDRYPGLEAYPHDKTSHAVTYLNLDRTTYPWEVTDFVKPDVEDLVIYELLVRDFSDQRTYQEVISKLDYLEDLGVNALELMPVMEYEGNISWGYNPSFMLAADKYYGTENELKLLIDEAHKRGMAVILDIVLNHAFGRSPLVRIANDPDYGAPTNENVWLNRTARHPYNVGYDFNHTSQYTKDYIDRVNAYWIEEYNVDGYRFDLSKGFTQTNYGDNVDAWGKYDAGRIAILKRMADQIWNVDPETYVILEHFADNSEETELANYGMLLWGNVGHEFKSLGKGLVRRLDWAYHEDRGWNDPHLIAYMESHDEERVMFELLKGGSRSLTQSLARSQINAAFFLPIPGPKMIWQFGEMGYDEELNNDRLGIKPTHWEYLDVPGRKKLHDVYQALANLKTKTDYLNSRNFTWNTDDHVKWMNFDNPDVKVCIIGNFDTESVTTNAHLLQNGTWYNYLNDATIEVSDFLNYELTLGAGEFKVFTSAPIENYIDEDPFILSNDDPLEDLSISPNPAHSTVTVTSSYLIKQVRILDLQGRQIERVSLTYDQGRKCQIGLGNLLAGIYMVELTTDRGILSRRMIKE